MLVAIELTCRYRQSLQQAAVYCRLIGADVTINEWVPSGCANFELNSCCITICTLSAHFNCWRHLIRVRRTAAVVVVFVAAVAAAALLHWALCLQLLFCRAPVRNGHHCRIGAQQSVDQEEQQLFGQHLSCTCCFVGQSGHDAHEQSNTDQLRQLIQL